MATQRMRNPNGAGTITQRKDGRYQAAVYVLQPDGTRARKFAYGKTWSECDTKRRELLAKVDQGVPVPTRSAKLAEWLPYWLENIVRPHRKRTTFAKYETHVRLYLVPLLGKKRLESLGVADVRRALVQLQKETSAATAKESHRVLRTAITAACREELVSRNVVSLVEPPKVQVRELSPWELDETLDFLAAARKDPLYPAFVLAIARSGCGGVNWWACAGRTWIWTSGKSGYGLRGSAFTARPTRTTPRGAAAGRPSPCPGSVSLPCAGSG